jgi:hypothetical protein
MLQADDGSWVANFHSQADAEYVIAALEVYHRFHVLEEAKVEPKPASPLPWRIGTHHKFVKTADGFRRRSVVIDPQGREVAHVLTSEDGDFGDAEYLVQATNAYPHLKAALDKALEACRWLEAARRLEEAQIMRWDKFTCATYEKCQVNERRCLARARRLAREALEMAKERDRRD